MTEIEDEGRNGQRHGLSLSQIHRYRLAISSLKDQSLHQLLRVIRDLRTSAEAQRAPQAPLPVNLVWEMTSPKSSAKYGRSSRRNFALMMRFSLECVELNSPPRISDSRVILSAERLCVFLKANFSSPSEKPGKGWNRDPALATTAR